MRRSLACFIAAALFAAAGTSAVAQDKLGVAPIRVFDAGELTLDQYTVIERLWTGTWRASFWIPTENDAGSAIAALTSKAESLGADGVVNLHCVNDAGGWGGGYYCYGLAIKLR
jgi:uncharacterized protein YbjQ (UPF0145 family)